MMLLTYQYCQDDIGEINSLLWEEELEKAILNSFPQLNVNIVKTINPNKLSLTGAASWEEYDLILEELKIISDDVWKDLCNHPV